MWRVEEVYEAGKRASQPGWDYVIDTGFDPSKAPIRPTNKKRTAGRAAPGDTTAKQNDAILKRLRELEKDNHRDVSVPVPKSKDAATGRPKGKTQPTRKVLSYQKTFKAWLESEEAEKGAAANNPVQQKREPIHHPRAGRPILREGIKEEPMEDAEEVVALRPASDGTDDSHLLQTVIPSLPSETEMERLCSAPPLSYADALAGPSTSGQPPLHFCQLCGYWGKIKCIMCGTRVCGLSCKQKHDVECQKYGGR